MTLLALFFSFLKVGACSIGGGYAAIPFIQSEMVLHRGWLTAAEFSDLVSIAEMTPGPIAVNAATFVGLRIAGIPGALTATFGCILPALIIASLLALLCKKKTDTTEKLLSVLRPVVVALIASAAVGMITSAVFSGPTPDLLNLLLFLGALALLRIKKSNPILIMLLCGGGGLLVRLLLPL